MDGQISVAEQETLNGLVNACLLPDEKVVCIIKQRRKKLTFLQHLSPRKLTRTIWELFLEWRQLQPATLKSNGCLFIGIVVLGAACFVLTDNNNHGSNIWICLGFYGAMIFAYQILFKILSGRFFAITNKRI